MAKQKYDELTTQLSEYMKHKQLPVYLQSRIWTYFEFQFQKSYFREDKILGAVSSTLRQEIQMHSCKKLVENVDFFRDLPMSFLMKIVTILHHEIFMTNDVILKANTYGDSMYFIATGTVAIYTKSGKEICHLTDGNHFGEVALVVKTEKRIASVVATECSEMYRLNRKDFMRALLPYPDLLTKIQHIAATRKEETDAADDRMSTKGEGGKDRHHHTISFSATNSPHLSMDSITLKLLDR
nr:potassium/sodium hyperpolarization-activated cyclic nucleotide-gated channel 2-like [Onthophagus taurus]